MLNIWEFFLIKINRGDLEGTAKSVTTAAIIIMFPSDGIFLFYSPSTISASPESSHNNLNWLIYK